MADGLYANHDAEPAAKAQTDSVAGEPSDGHGSDGTDKPVTRPVLGTGNTQEPVAWAVLGDDFEYVSLMPEMCVEWAGENGGRTVPLYATPEPPSTPGEGRSQGECTLLRDARETLADIDARRVGVTHYEGCRRDHTGCLLAQLIREVELLREAIRRLADQDATLSVCDGAVTVTMDATLTDEEREAIRNACKLGTFPDEVATLRRLLARTGHETGHVPDSRTANGRES